MRYCGLYAYAEIETAANADFNNRVASGTDPFALLAANSSQDAIVQKVKEWGKEGAACRCAELMELAKDLRDDLEYMTIAMKIAFPDMDEGVIDIGTVRAERYRTLLGLE